MMKREELARIALRYDTTMSRAMLRALNIKPPKRRKRGRTSKRLNKYADIHKCFSQRHGVR